MTQEEAFVRAFIVSDKQARYLDQLASRKRRDLFLDRLNHHLDYDASLAVRVPPNQQSAAGIEALLRKKGAPDTCHVISSLAKWDGRETPLREALDIVVGYGIGTVLCCVPGRLAYYESEELSERYIFTK